MRPPKIPRPSPAPLRTSTAARALAERVRDASDPGACARAVAEFWSGAGSASPALEQGENGERILTFLWRSSTAHAILLFVNRLTDETDIGRSELRRVAGTDVWHLSYALEEGWRGSYGFVVHEGPDVPPWRPEQPEGRDQVRLRALLDRAQPDPRNPLACPNRAGRALSVAQLPDAPPQPWVGAEAAEPLEAATGPRGRRCWIFDGTRGEVETARAAGGSAETAAGGSARSSGDDRQAPLWLILDGEVWADQLGLGAMLAAMTRAGAAPPVRAVLIDSGGTERRWRELGEGGAFVDELADEWLPWAEERFGASIATARRGIAGQSLGGLTALACGLRRPDAFGMILAQSASLWLQPLDVSPLAGLPRNGRPRFRIEVGTQEWVLREPNRELHDRLVAAGADSELVEFAGGHDYACWRGGLPDGIAALSAGG